MFLLNGLENEPIPAELAIWMRCKQLIQRAKAFQTIVRLGTYTAKVTQVQLAEGVQRYHVLSTSSSGEDVGNAGRGQTAVCGRQFGLT